MWISVSAKDADKRTKAAETASLWKLNWHVHFPKHFAAYAFWHLKSNVQCSSKKQENTLKKASVTITSLFYVQPGGRLTLEQKSSPALWSQYEWVIMKWIEVLAHAHTTYSWKPHNFCQLCVENTDGGAVWKLVYLERYGESRSSLWPFSVPALAVVGAISFPADDSRQAEAQSECCRTWKASNIFMHISENKLWGFCATLKSCSNKVWKLRVSNREVLFFPVIVWFILFSISALCSVTVELDQSERSWFVAPFINVIMCKFLLINCFAAALFHYLIQFINDSVYQQIKDFLICSLSITRGASYY